MMSRFQKDWHRSNRLSREYNEAKLTRDDGDLGEGVERVTSGILKVESNTFLACTRE